MITAGCDIGSLTAKAVIADDGNIIGQAVIRALPRPAESASSVMTMAIEHAGVKGEEITCCMGTGYGREQIPFVSAVESEISCHAKGAFYLMPDVRMVIDIGGQDAKATRMDDHGKVVRYIYNDKCASGTGRFLEVMAEALEIPLDKMGETGAKAQNKLTISNQCVIFAESEVISLINEGRGIPDIVDALHHAMARRVAALARSIEVVPDVVMTGGVAKNAGVFLALSEALGVELKSIIGQDPQVIGAFGAALFALERARK